MSAKWLKLGCKGLDSYIQESCMCNHRGFYVTWPGYSGKSPGFLSPIGPYKCKRKHCVTCQRCTYKRARDLKAGENNLSDGINMIEPMHEVCTGPWLSQADRPRVSSNKKVVMATS